MSDKFKNYTPGVRDPIQSAIVVSPNDSVDLPVVSRAIYVGSGGDMQVTLLSGDVVTFKNMLAGWHPIRVSRIWNTETTASEIVSCS